MRQVLLQRCKGEIPRLALVGALAQVVLSGDECKVRGAVVIRVPKGRVGGRRAAAVAQGGIA